MNVREYLLASGVPRRVVWVSNDLRLAGLSIEHELYDLLTKSDRAGCRYRAGAHYIDGVSPKSSHRLRGLSTDAVFLEDHDALEDELEAQLAFSMVGKERVWWFDDRGNMKGPW